METGPGLLKRVLALQSGEWKGEGQKDWWVGITLLGEEKKTTKKKKKSRVWRSKEIRFVEGERRRGGSEKERERGVRERGRERETER